MYVCNGTRRLCQESHLLEEVKPEIMLCNAVNFSLTELKVKTFVVRIFKVTERFIKQSESN